MILSFLEKRGERAENNNGESKRGPEGSFSHIFGEKKNQLSRTWAIEFGVTSNSLD